MLYPAKLYRNPDTNCYIVSFRDIPEALTQGYSLDEAKEQALDALISAFDFYFEDNRSIPMPSKALEGEYLIELPISVWSKVLLLNAMLEQHVSQSDLAKRLHRSRQEMQRIIDLSHNTKIDTIVDALKQLGKHPVFTI
ncbi:type II toxin-antitoxin system HicB family antitoxin [Acinetobacter bereziniae]|uniref:type II toxin-antitoxin system HicB family antitoxin n=1 Tax=Acinetobacter bereziniae TaxID=106648 RepID=UPI003AF6FE41